MVLPHNTNNLSMDTNGHRFNGPFNHNGPMDVAHINHYHSKTKEDWMLRCERGRADCNIKQDPNQWDRDVNNDIEIVDLLWLDIQGMELEVIQSSELTIRRKVKLIHLEISRIKFYDATPSEKNIRLFLKNIGFRCVIDKVGAISGNALYLNTNIKN
jgi:hypothetical protein